MQFNSPAWSRPSFRLIRDDANNVRNPIATNLRLAMARASIAPNSLMLHDLSHLEIPAEGVCELHLARRLAFRLEQLRRTAQDGHAFRPADGHVRSVRAVEKLHSARCVRVAGRGLRVDRDRGFFTLKPVNRPDVSAGEAFLNLEHVSVVGCDDDDVFQGQGPGYARFHGPPTLACQTAARHPNEFR